MSRPSVSTPDEIWNRFIDKLNETEPLGKKNEPVLHQNFIGSIKKYKKIYDDANRLPEPLSD